MIVVALDAGKPVTRDEVSWNVWTGDAKNRWFDKHQFVVFDNGRSGFLGALAVFARFKLSSSFLVLYVGSWLTRLLDTDVRRFRSPCSAGLQASTRAWTEHPHSG